MRVSTAALSAGFYNEQHTTSAVRYIAVPDGQLIDDGTYFVVEVGSPANRQLPTANRGSVIACGGWSARRKLFTGTSEQESIDGWLDPATDAARIRAMFVDPAHARRGLGRLILNASEEAAQHAGFRVFELMATLPGVPLYRACGYEEVEPSTLELPDGTRLGAMLMRRSLSRA
ncbi:MAG TPA: GNAT family N-acetyltransferase [Thermoanaerobaculia bacterium]|nr:GNAT family N-acetyltransferase [Thermoanaerobaculia bacterium]